MDRTSDMLNRFARNDSGAVTVDWVVMTAAVLVIGLAVLESTGSGVTSLGVRIAQALDTTEVGGTSPGAEANAATHYFDLGIAQSPDNRRDAWRNARMAVHEDAPAGFNYNPEFDETRYVDSATGMPVYEANDGGSYNIGGEVVSRASYNPADSGASFMSTFNGYWGS